MVKKASKRLGYVRGDISSRGRENINVTVPGLGETWSGILFNSSFIGRRDEFKIVQETGCYDAQGKEESISWKDAEKA